MDDMYCQAAMPPAAETAGPNMTLGQKNTTAMPIQSTLAWQRRGWRQYQCVGCRRHITGSWASDGDWVQPVVADGVRHNDEGSA